VPPKTGLRMSLSFGGLLTLCGWSAAVRAASLLLSLFLEFAIVIRPVLRGHLFGANLSKM
jgi:hypothetical protein